MPFRRFDSPSSGVFIQPFPATGARYQVPKLQSDFQPVWSPDGTELFYVPFAASGRLAAVRVSTQSGVTFGSPQSLPARVTSLRPSYMTRAFDILPDGKFIGLVSGPEDVTSSPSVVGSEIRVVLNWLEELKRLVPVK